MRVNISGLQHVLSQLTLFAQNPPKEAPNPLLQAVPMLVAFMVMFYLIILRPQQKETARRQELLNTLKKNDKVLTAGGIIGTIVDFSGDGSRVTLRVDDGTRIKFTRSSIQGPYNEKADAEGGDSK
ncbi:MAG: preprotein translocase subunit YajC [Planctomycetaceae bacterium]|nr:preprotein translocase subunit YajC [Planctomycetaceae bacterium]